MSRTATPLNCEQPAVGCAYVIRNVKSKKLIRASTTCQRDIDRKGSNVKVLRAFSGAEPFFTAKIGSLHTEIEVLKFLAGAQHKKCRDTTGTYEWTGMTLADAIKQKVEFAEPGRIVKDAAPTKTVKVKKAKNVKAKKVVKKARKSTPAVEVAAVAPVVVASTPAEAAAEVAEPVAAVKATPKPNTRKKPLSAKQVAKNVLALAISRGEIPDPAAKPLFVAETEAAPVSTEFEAPVVAETPVATETAASAT